MASRFRKKEHLISTKLSVVLGIGAGFLAGYLCSRALLKTGKDTDSDNSLKVGKYRRFITGHDENGKAILLKKDCIPNRKKPQNRNISVYNIWRCMNHHDANIENDIDKIDLCSKIGLIPLEPSLYGSNFRIIEFEPESTVKDFYKSDDKKIGAAWSDFGVSNKKVFGGKAAKHPFMHKTESIDYAVCLYGKMYMVLDEEEVLIKAGDTIVQRGTNHSWKNCFQDVCIMMFVLIHSPDHNR